MRTPPPYNKREYLSITTLLSFVRCPRLYFYRKSGICSQEESNALAYGTAMHRAIHVATLEGFEAAMKAFLEVWDDSLADDKRSISRARAQLAHFVHTHSEGRSLYTFQKPPECGGIELSDDVSPYEVPAILDVGLPVPIFVRIDGLVRHRDTKELWGYEFKTSSRMDSRIFEALELHPQILTYTLALRTVTKEPVRGMMTEAMLIDKTKVDNLTHPIPVQDHHVNDIANWLRYYGGLLLDCERRYEEAGNDPNYAFPKNTSGCSAYPHYYITSWPCDYMNLCRVPDWRNMLSYYTIKPEHNVVKLTTEGR